MGLSEVIGPVPYAPEVGDVGLDTLAEHEFPQSVDGAAMHITMTVLPVGGRYVAPRELAEPELEQPAGASDLWIELALGKVEEERVGRPTGSTSAQGSSHQLPKRVVLELGQGMCFLSIKKFAIEDGTGNQGLAFPRYREPSDALRHRAQPRSYGVEHRVFLTVTEVVDPQVAGNRHGRLPGVGVPSPTSGNRVVIDLFFGVVEQHIVIPEGLLYTGKAVGEGDGRPQGSGLNHQDVHVVNVISKLPWDWLLGRGPQKSLEHILGEGTAGNEPMIALGRKGGGTMGA